MTNDDTTHFGFKQVPSSEKADKVAEVFHSVAARYDLMNDVMSLGSHRIMKRFAVELTAAKANHVILDLAGGTGDLAARLSKLVGDSGRVILCDINQSMLALGRDRLIDQGMVSNVSFLQADGEALPLPNNSLDAIIIGFGLRNFTHKQAAMTSMINAIKPAGRLIILDFSRPKNAIVKSAFDFFKQLWPKIGKQITGDADSYQYLVESIDMHPDQETLKQMMVDSGYVRCRYHSLFNGLAAIHTGRKPGSHITDSG